MKGRNSTRLKIIHEIVKLSVGLQFPEGLCIYARAVSDLLTKYTGCETLIMADVAYGACCVDDLTAKELGTPCYDSD